MEELQKTLDIIQYKCWYYTSYHRGHGYLNVNQALQKSCNYFFYETGLRMGIDNLSKYALHFGLGKKTGIELPSESAGTVASKETKQNSNREDKNRYQGDTAISSIGQGDNNYTPMQIARYISAIANGGTVVNPTIIKTILNSDGTEISKEEIAAVIILVICCFIFIFITDQFFSPGYTIPAFPK